MGESWGQITRCHGNQSFCSKEECTRIHGSGSQQRLVSISLSFFLFSITLLDCEIVNFFFVNRRFFVRALNARWGHSSDWLGYLYNLDCWYMCWVVQDSRSLFFSRALPSSLSPRAHFGLLALEKLLSLPWNSLRFPGWDSSELIIPVLSHF